MRRRFLARFTAVTLAVILPLATFVAGTRVADQDEPPGFDRIAAAGLRLLQESALPVTVDQLVEAAIEGMLEAIDDPYAALLTSEEQAQLQDLVNGGELVGIGVWLHPARNGLRVTGVIPDTPAAEAGLRAGDVIVKVDGVAVAVAKKGVDRTEPLRGEAGTTVELEIFREGKTITRELVRRSIPIPNVIPRRLASGVGYVRMLQFGQGVSDELRAAVTGLLSDGVSGILLDLRDNPGGLAHEAFDSASVFVDEGLLGTVQTRGEDPQQVHANGTALEGDFPLVVLVNGHSASASEIMAAALDDRGRATLVGSRTFGKGSVLTVEPVTPEGPTIRFTTAFFIRPNGDPIEGLGVKPLYPVPATGKGDRALRLGERLVIAQSRV
jgi:carboxyl-terminal processing protease